MLPDVYYVVDLPLYLGTHILKLTLDLQIKVPVSW